MQITLIRHLPTEWNKKHQLQGRRDIGISPLTNDFLRGIAENQLILKEMAPFDLVLASSLKRTHQTALVYGYQAETEALLDELDFGPFEGQLKETLASTFGELWLKRPKEIILGESLQNLEDRIALFLRKYQRFQKLLVFGHGAWIRAIISYIEYDHIDNLNKIELRNNACITLTWNEHKNELEG